MGCGEWVVFHVCGECVVCCERRVFQGFLFSRFCFFIVSCTYVQRLDLPYLQVPVKLSFIGNKQSCLVLSCLVLAFAHPASRLFVSSLFYHDSMSGRCVIDLVSRV